MQKKDGKRIYKRVKSERPDLPGVGDPEVSPQLLPAITEREVMIPHPDAAVNHQALPEEDNQDPVIPANLEKAGRRAKEIVRADRLLIEEGADQKSMVTTWSPCFLLFSKVCVTTTKSFPVPWHALQNRYLLK